MQQLPEEIIHIIFTMIKTFDQVVLIRQINKKYHKFFKPQIYYYATKWVTIDDYNFDNLPLLFCLFYNDGAEQYATLNNKHLLIHRTYFGIPFLFDEGSDYYDYQIIYNKNKRGEFVSHKNYRSPITGEIFIYRDNINTLCYLTTVPNNICLDLFSYYYINTSHYPKLVILYTLKIKYKHYLKYIDDLKVLTWFTVYLYYNSIIFRLNMDTIELKDLSVFLTNIVYRETTISIEQVDKDTYITHYQEIINKLYPRLKHAIVNYYFDKLF